MRRITKKPNDFFLMVSLFPIHSVHTEGKTPYTDRETIDAV